MKRILTIDGGGIRGVFALQVLRRVEALFREREERDDLVLADVMDLIAGTSTGAIVAACLSWGMTVDEVERLYLEHGSAMFSRSPWRLRLRAKYRADKMATVFKAIFQEHDGSLALLGTERLKTMLMVVMRNATTGSPWPITNNSKAQYNERGRDGCNLDIPLWQLLRASTAAPTFFTPERIKVGKETFLFVDGGISPYNNPTLLAVLTATLPGYRVGWPTGRDKLHVTSVGTGTTRSVIDGPRADRAGLLRMAGFVPAALMGSIVAEQDMLCRVIGDCIHGDPIDSELGDLHGPGLFENQEKRFTYVRYNRRLDVADDTTMLPPLMKARLDDLTLMPKLQALGQEYANLSVQPEHLGLMPEQ